MNYSGNTVLITGGNAGIGLEMARSFHARRLSVVAIRRPLIRRVKRCLG
jgi:short-subunit dehydrogenase involved in D-alanine esterification of teichoic acids